MNTVWSIIYLKYMLHGKYYTLKNVYLYEFKFKLIYITIA